MPKVGVDPVKPVVYVTVGAGVDNLLVADSFDFTGKFVHTGKKLVFGWEEANLFVQPFLHAINISLYRVVHLCTRGKLLQFFVQVIKHSLSLFHTTSLYCANDGL